MSRTATDDAACAGTESGSNSTLTISDANIVAHKEGRKLATTLPCLPPNGANLLTSRPDVDTTECQTLLDIVDVLLNIAQ